jgi:hypothetical protein
MPITFLPEIDERTLDPGDFTIATRNGEQHTPLCATTAPANQENEDRTVLLIGELGSAQNDPPAQATVTGTLLDESGGDLRGASREVTPLEAGPRLVYAEVARPEDDRHTYPPGTPTQPILAQGQATTRCPPGTPQTVRVTWDGGVSNPDGGEVTDQVRASYRVVLPGLRQARGKRPKARGKRRAERRRIGTRRPAPRRRRRARRRRVPRTRTVVPYALGDLNDFDNNHLLCLRERDRPLSVKIGGGVVVDPRHDFNPATSVSVTPEEAPG